MTLSESSVGIRLHLHLWRRIWFGSVEPSPPALIRAAF